MAEKGQTSSMTSVTEEDVSVGSESDTTESSYSNVTSSLLSSTDTDDKLTPGLIKISISNSKNNATKRTIKLQEHPEKILTGKSDGTLLNEQTEVKVFEEVTCKRDPSVTATQILAPNFVHPYGANPIPLKYAKGDKKRQYKESNIYHQMYGNLPYGKEGMCQKNMGVSDYDGKLSTDFSDTSSIQMYDNRNNNNEFDLDSDENDETRSDESSVKHCQPLLPDLSSETWYQAPCFDRYWSHYRFVMEWYRMHVQAVKVLQAQMAGPWSYPAEPFSHSQDPWQTGNRGDSTRSHQSRRASHRNRAKGKSRRRSRRRSQATSFSTVDQDDVTSARAMAQSPRQKKRYNHKQKEEEELEMEITDEMLDFFTTSYKHKLERAKADEMPASLAPTERPGVRRTKEMKEIYGAGSPMIQAMETAMQMSFDRFLDKSQPSLWPNMPLKINFQK